MRHITRLAGLALAAIVPVLLHSGPARADAEKMIEPLRSGGGAERMLDGTSNAGGGELLFHLDTPSPPPTDATDATEKASDVAPSIARLDVIASGCLAFPGQTLCRASISWTDGGNVLSIEVPASPTSLEKETLVVTATGARPGFEGAARLSSSARIFLAMDANDWAPTSSPRPLAIEVGRWSISAGERTTSWSPEPVTTLAFEM
jgi:hypothetical protein